MPAPRKVSGAVATRSPAAWAASSSARPLCAVERERLLAPDVLACGERPQRDLDVHLGKRQVDDDLDARRRRAARRPSRDPGTPNASAWLRARSWSMSATKRTSRSGKVVRFLRYSVLMTPAPMTPTPTVPAPRRAHASPFEVRKAKLSAMAWKRSPRESSSSMTRSASGAAAMMSAMGSEPWPTATWSLVSVVAGAVLDVERDDAVAESLRAAPPGPGHRRRPSRCRPRARRCR